MLVGDDVTERRLDVELVRRRAAVDVETEAGEELVKVEDVQDEVMVGLRSRRRRSDVMLLLLAVGKSQQDVDWNRTKIGSVEDRQLA